MSAEQPEQVTIRSQVEASLESKWTTLDAAHRSIVQLGNEGLTALISIATDDRQPYLRRWHAVLLLATFDNGESAAALAAIANGKSAQFRCFALNSIAGLSERRAVPALAGKLDDNSVCMKTLVTDPAREYDVYVSDEAVRLLERVTGQQFEKQSPGYDIKHRATEPWKKWWAKNKSRYTSKD